MTQTRPNILFINCHDLGRHLGGYGVETVSSPNLDRLAEEGIRFDNVFCVAPQCSPSRAATYTGRYPHNNGVMGLAHGVFGWDLYDDERPLASLLRNAGWHTALVGFQHASLNVERLGFDEIFPMETWADWECTRVAQRAVEFLHRQRKAESPYYLQVGISEPHRKFDRFGTPPDDSRGVTVAPYLVDEPSAREEFAAFQGSIRKMDAAVGEILAALDESGQRDQTLVIFTTDHGIPFPRAKCSLYDPGLEICFMIRWPQSGWESGTVYSEMIANIDYVPTLLDLVGVPIPERVQGRSFVPLLRGTAYEPRTELFAEKTYHDYYAPQRCIRTETHKLIVNFSNAPSFMDTSQSWRPKTITKQPPDPAYAYHEPVELYDLIADPLEFNNLAESEEHQQLRQRLLARLYTWMVETADPLLQGVPISPMHRRALAALDRTKVLP